MSLVLLKQVKSRDFFDAFFFEEVKLLLQLEGLELGLLKHRSAPGCTQSANERCLKKQEKKLIAVRILAGKANGKMNIELLYSVPGDSNDTRLSGQIRELWQRRR